jgi:hypothetical protein
MDNRYKEFVMPLLKIMLCAVILAAVPCEGAQARPESMKEAVVAIIRAFASRNPEIINRHIHPHYGLTVLFRMGVFSDYETVSMFSFDKPVPEFMSYRKIRMDSWLRYGALPVYDCQNEAWSKVGLFCDPVHHDHLLSDTALQLRQYRGDAIAQQSIERFVEIEHRSRRIVLIDKVGGELIFYLTKVGSRWYMTILDRVSGDCSA